MRDDLRERRQKTFQLWWVEGRQRHKVCERLAEEYDVQPNTIDRDMERVDSWLPKLDTRPSQARLWVKTMRQNIRERQRELRDAKQDPEMGPHDMLPLRDALDKAIERLLGVEQSIGDVEQVPARIEVAGDPANPVQHAHGHDHVHEHEGEVTMGRALTDTAEMHIEALIERDHPGNQPELPESGAQAQPAEPDGVDAQAPDAETEGVASDE